MSKESVIKSKVTSKNIVIEIPKEFIINDFNESSENCRVKGNRKNKFLKSVADQLVEHLANEDVLFDIYDYLASSDDVKYIDNED